MFIGRSGTAMSTREYGGDFRRLYPWRSVVDTPWGSAWMTIAPGEASTAHSHDEEETFIIISGSGVMRVDDEQEAVGKGDVIFLPRFSEHQLKNTSTTNPLEFLCIWWGEPSRPPGNGAD